MTGKKSESLFSLIPSVDRLLSNPDIQRLLNLYSPSIIKRIITSTLDNVRSLIRNDKLIAEDLSHDVLVGKNSACS